MTTLADVEDVAVFLNRTLTSGESAQAGLLLDIASDAIRRHTGQTITLVEDDAVELVGNWSSVLVLPERPVTAVSLVTLAGQSLTLDLDYHRIKDRLIRGPGGVGYNVTPSYLGWGGPDQKVTLTYTHGFSDVPDLVRGVCLGMVARAMANPSGGATAETIGQYSVTYATAAAAASYMLPDERLALRRWLRRP